MLKEDEEESEWELWVLMGEPPSARSSSVVPAKGERGPVSDLTKPPPGRVVTGDKTRPVTAFDAPADSPTAQSLIDSQERRKEESDEFPKKGDYCPYEGCRGILHQPEEDGSLECSTCQKDPLDAEELGDDST